MQVGSVLSEVAIRGIFGLNFPYLSSLEGYKLALHQNSSPRLSYSKAGSSVYSIPSATQVNPLLQIMTQISRAGRP